MESVLALVCMFCTVALSSRAVEGVTLPHAHRHKRLQHLQEAVDRLVIRQRTDHILINNLQKAVLEAQEGGVWPERAGRAEGERRALSELKDAVNEVRGSVNLVLEEQHHADEILELRQELAALRSEVKHLKESREAESRKNLAHSQTQQQREAVTAAWVVDNVRRLQDAVVDLQQAFNVTTAMHDKQEVESRLLVVSRDLGALRGSLAAVTSKAEAAAATVTALQEEITSLTQDSHRSAGKVATLEMEVSSIHEDFSDLLVSLPEGLVSGGHTQHSAKPTQVHSGKATMGTEEKVKGQRLEPRVEAVETGLGEVQASSMQLLAMLEALEARVEKDVGEVRQEVAKLEYKMTAAQDDSKT
ncbi:uncharacterized protein LOC135091738 [Scylla paramamosain]|uniref:uncharacterized protein LOC135091738 n=1 Tax=Scylla paramamosain TaxID=85552 RepID=UPI00308312F6